MAIFLRSLSISGHQCISKQKYKLWTRFSRLTHDPNEILSDVVQHFDPSKKEKVFLENDLNRFKKILLIQKMQDHIKNLTTVKTTTVKPRHSGAGKTGVFSKNGNVWVCE